MIDYGLVLDRITRDPRYLANLDWGSPRRGHPEATIRAHIEELTTNLMALAFHTSDEEHNKLLVLIHVHDTFKPDSHARRSASAAPAILDPDSHASIARAFLSEFTDDPEMLATVQYHDEPFALYRHWKYKGKLSIVRFEALLKAIPDWDLFLAFVIMDGTTAGKATEPRDWFLSAISQRVTTRWTKETVAMLDKARIARECV